MEACGGARHWGRAIIDLGHECRLIPTVYVKPFVRRRNHVAAVRKSQGWQFVSGASDRGVPHGSVERFQPI